MNHIAHLNRPSFFVWPCLFILSIKIDFVEDTIFQFFTHYLYMYGYFFFQLSNSIKVHYKWYKRACIIIISLNIPYQMMLKMYILWCKVIKYSIYRLNTHLTENIHQTTVAHFSNASYYILDSVFLYMYMYLYY